MGIKFEESVDAESIGRPSVGSEDKPAEPTRAIVVAPEPIIVPVARPIGPLVPRLIADAGEQEREAAIAWIALAT